MVEYISIGLGVIVGAIFIAKLHVMAAGWYFGSHNKRAHIWYNLGMWCISNADAAKHRASRRALYLAAARDRCNSEDPNLPAWGE